jgi:UDPglucose--hexose-1-phosphate uridylyltransferase
MIEFTSKVITTTILDPRKDFTRKEIKTEIRYDPLTGESRRLAHFGVIKPQKEDFSSWDTPENRSRCPFCPPNIEKMTPRFPPEHLRDGYLRRGETTLIPNISPYDQFSALVAMGHQHVVPLEGLTPRLLKDALMVGLDFFRIIAAKKYSLPYHIIIWNYMPPSGGGIVHPHQQIIISDSPGNLFRKSLENSQRYYQAHHQNYWKEICLAEEKKGQRLAGRLERSCWLASFAPLGVLGEFLGIFPDVHTIFDLDEVVIDELVSGLERLFRYFSSINIYSFNMGIFFAPEGTGEYFSLHLRVIPRLFLNRVQKTPDVNALQMVMQEPFAVVLPEKQCTELRSFW